MVKMVFSFDVLYLFIMQRKNYVVT